jgi:hypothetical protein
MLLSAGSSSLLTSIPLHGHTAVCPAMLPLKDHWAIFNQSCMDIYVQLSFSSFLRLSNITLYGYVTAIYHSRHWH